MIQDVLPAATAVDTSQMISSQLAGAALLAYLLQWIKSTKLLPWVSEHTKGINYALTGVMSLVAAVGIHYQFDSTSGVLTISGLHTSSVLHGLWEWLKQWAFQQGAADMIFSKQVAKETANAQALPIAISTGDGGSSGKL